MQLFVVVAVYQCVSQNCSQRRPIVSNRIYDAASAGSFDTLRPPRLRVVLRRRLAWCYSCSRFPFFSAFSPCGVAFGACSEMLLSGFSRLGLGLRLCSWSRVATCERSSSFVLDGLLRRCSLLLPDGALLFFSSGAGALASCSTLGTSGPGVPA